MRRNNYGEIIRRGRETRADTERSAWGPVVMLAAIAASIGAIGAVIKERADAIADKAYVEARVQDACRITRTDSDRIRCETEVRREVFGREQ